MKCLAGLISVSMICACAATENPIPKLQQATIPVCNITDYGAVSADGRVDTHALQNAINDCRGREGTVVLPAGDWSTGALRLGSNMTLQIDEGAVLSLYPDIDLFPEFVSETDDGVVRIRAALFAEGVSGLRITGKGRIEGNGASFWDEDFYNSGLRRPTLPRPGPTIELADCSDTHVSGITLTNMPHYAVRFNRCDGVSAEDLTVRNDPRSPNTDGIQIRDTSNAVLRRLDIQTGDDAIVLKSGKRVVDNILVEDSNLQSDDGAIKFGTGSAVGVTNSVFRNIDIAKTRYGVAIFMLDGGHHKNNLFENIRIENGGRHARNYPIYMDIDRREADRSLGQIENTTFRDIEIVTNSASLIAGNPAAPIRNVKLERIKMTVPDPLDLTARPSKPRGNINIEDQGGSVDYSTRAAHFVFGHIEGLTLRDVSIETAAVPSERVGATLIDVDMTDPPDLSYTLGSGEAGHLMRLEN